MKNKIRELLDIDVLSDMHIIYPDGHIEGGMWLNPHANHLLNTFETDKRKLIELETNIMKRINNSSLSF